MKRTVLVTGASAGIGKATALHLAQQGYTVYGTARRLASMQDLQQAGIHVLAMDVTDEDSMVSGVQQILAAEGTIDVLVNSAGFGSYGAVEDVPLTDAKYQLDVNLFGAARLTQLVLPAMRAQHWGKIVNISSVGGKLANPFGAWYHASKFALEALSDSLRNEVKPFGIDVVVIEPGGIQSEWAGIAHDSLLKVSGHSAYQGMVRKFGDALKTTEAKLPGPDLIADLVQRAIEAKSPRTRYAGGYLAKPLLFLRKVLSDKMMDRLTMSQLR